MTGCRLANDFTWIWEELFVVYLKATFRSFSAETKATKMRGTCFPI